MLRDGTLHRNLRPDHGRRSPAETHARQLARQIAKLGLIAPASAAEAAAIW